MKVTIGNRPSYATARVELSAGEQVKAEAGAMLAMRGDVDLKTSSGGVMKGLKRAFMGGESFFQNTFTAGARGGSVFLAPALPGDIFHTRLEGRTLVVQDGSYLASAPEVRVDTAWSGARGFFSGEGFVMLKVSGAGDLLLSSFGAIEEHALEAGEDLTVDTGHLVAFDDGMPHEIRRVGGGLKSMVFSGEGVVTRFTGPGTVWTQSRSHAGFLDWIASKAPGGGGQGGGRGGFFGMLGE